MTDLRSKFLGGMAGSALGDAIGELAFRFPEEGRLELEAERRETLFYTDDTSMAIGLAESLRTQGDLNPEHLCEIFVRNFEREPWRGYAQGPPAIFLRVRREGVSCTEAAASLFGGEGSFGNGAAMRITPLGLFFCRESDLYEKAALSASVTHSHSIGIDGAAVLALSVSQAVGLDPKRRFSSAGFIEPLIRFAKTAAMQKKLILIRELIFQETPLDRAADKLGRGIEADLSVPFAIYAFLRSPKSFEECLMGAVLHGGDRDTLGAMACGIAGAYLGLDAIPDKWLTRLENRPYLEELAAGLMRASPR
ncbi:ADP-ribosylglycohydrolase family protein [Nitrospinota bacterium]